MQYNMDVEEQARVLFFTSVGLHHVLCMYNEHTSSQKRSEKVTEYLPITGGVPQIDSLLSHSRPIKM